MSASVPTVTLDRFQVFSANHGPLESPLAQGLLDTFFQRSINRFYEYPQQGTTLQEYVEREFKRHSPDILACLELAADWSTDPLKAAGRLLRADLEALAMAEADAKKRATENSLHAAVKAKADAFMEQLKKGASSLV